MEWRVLPPLLWRQNVPFIQLMSSCIVEPNPQSQQTGASPSFPLAHVWQHFPSCTFSLLLITGQFFSFFSSFFSTVPPTHPLFLEWAPSQSGLWTHDRITREDIPPSSSSEKREGELQQEGGESQRRERRVMNRRGSFGGENWCCCRQIKARSSDSIWFESLTRLYG